MLNEVTPLPAASAIVVREEPLEVLLLQRHANSSFVPNAWVFPGGIAERSESMAEVAVRETSEEAGIALDPGTLVLTSRWITPVGIPKRFDTYFFLAKVGRDAEVTIDGREITGWMWIAPADALARRDLHLVFPTIKNLEAIAPFTSADALIDSRRGAVIEPIQPVLVDGKPALR
ncbi:MAG TPA: NUDIX hydrolase [Thermoanaerobaculia bacterium]|nr:NUDIX hydrolase [Thermoanaerobaculia bacterium]